jgi:hypothetical protein
VCVKYDALTNQQPITLFPLPPPSRFNRCDRRCEATTAVEPPAYPVLSFYCALHGYQKPRQGQAADGLIIDPLYEMHLTRRTSFLAPEHSLAAEMAKAVGMVRDRAGAPKSTAGKDIVNWLVDRKGLTNEKARETALRMLTLEILVPLSGTALSSIKEFSDGKDALYRVSPKLTLTK